MNVVERRLISRRWMRLSRIFSLLIATILSFAAPLVTAADEATADDDAADNDDLISLTAYNAKADRIEDFGLRVRSSLYSGKPVPFLWKFAPLVSAVVPNTAAAKAGLQPGERILKSEGQSTVGGLFSTGKFGKWHKTQTKKWAEVASGKKNVTWTLEVQSPATKATRTVKLVVPSPPPHWGASIWRMPEGRAPAAVAEPGPLAERSRTVFENGIWALLDGRLERVLGVDYPAGSEPTGYEWRIGNRQEGVHRIFVTQFRGRTDIFFETRSPSTGSRVYLTSPSGALEKAWQWPRKGKSGETPLEEARESFESEIDFWTTKVGKFSARWPMEVRPGFDANAIFAVAAAKAGAGTAEVRPLAEQFLKLPPATEAQQAMFSDAYGKLGAEQENWAYTETWRGIEDKRVMVTRVDPSKPDAERCVLLSINGKPPTPADVQRWRDDGLDVPKALGDLPPLTNIVDLKDLRVSKEETAAIVFELPIRSGNAEFPTEKFQALFRVNKTYRSFEDITVRMRDSIRVAGVVKITEAGLQARFQTLDPAHPSQPVSLKGGGAARILLVKISRDFETTRTNFKRVQAYVEPDNFDALTAPISIPVPATL
ncbi:MAG: PDZ domain-containing protein [Opitutaceae bacterium]